MAGESPAWVMVGHIMAFADALKLRRFGALIQVACESASSIDQAIRMHAVSSQMLAVPIGVQRAHRFTHWELLAAPNLCAGEH